MRSILLKHCNADLHNNPSGRNSCLLLKNAAVFPDGSVHFSKSDNPDVAAAAAAGDGGSFPARSDRYFLRAAPLIAVSREELEKTTTRADRKTHIGLFTHNFIGAAFDNVWHTLSDFAVCLFDTLVPLMTKSASSPGSSLSLSDDDLRNLRAPVTWVTFPPGFSNFRDRSPCTSESECRKKVLFELFTKMFFHIDFVVSDTTASGAPQKKPVVFPFLVVGAATACSPVKTEGVGTARCKASLRMFRDHVLQQYGLDPDKQAVVTRASGKKQGPCPHILLMSRQRALYRKMHPWNEIVSELSAVSRESCAGSGEDLDKRFFITDLDSKTPFGQQLRSVNQADIFVAGRGGGTGLCIFLPLNATYISVSLSDRWNPHRDLEPPWLVLKHFEANPVHHLDPRLPAKKSKGRVDANKGDYRVDPRKLADEVRAAIQRY